MAATGTAAAQDNSVQGCELHVWPSGGLHSIYHGWFHGGIVDGAITHRDGYPPIPADPIGTHEQSELLSSLNLPVILALPTHKLIVHDNAPDSRTVRNGVARLSPSASPCYAELVADDVFFQEDAVNGGALKTLFRFRDFGRSATPERTFGTWAKTALKAFPPKLPSEYEASLKELRLAYTNNVALFAIYLGKSNGRPVEQPK